MDTNTVKFPGFNPQMDNWEGIYFEANGGILESGKLRDRFVCGMGDKRVQTELFNRDNLHYQDVGDAKLSSESVERDVQMLQEAEASATPRPAQFDMVPVGCLETIKVIEPKTNVRLCNQCGDHHSVKGKKVGYKEKVCMKRKKSKVNFNQLDNMPNGIYTFQSKVAPFGLRVYLADMPVQMQLDTGSSVSLINAQTWRDLRRHRPQIMLESSEIQLCTWTGSEIEILGKAILPVRFRDITKDLCVVVVKKNGPNLLGRDWMLPLDIKVNVYFPTNSELQEFKSLVNRHTGVFINCGSVYRGNPVAIKMKPGAIPKFLEARPVPYAIKDRVEKEIDKLERKGIIRPISHSDWASPIVPFVTKTGKIVFFGDYRSTVNEAIDTYPKPISANELFAIVAGGKFFTTLFPDQWNMHLVVDDTTSKLLTLNTCKGIYSVHRLGFRVKACPVIYSQLITSLLAGISGVAVLISDIIVCGQTMKEMLDRLDIVFDRIKKAGLRLKHSVNFAKRNIEFCGFTIDAEGIRPARSKIAAICDTPEPKNKQELKAFLGLYKFYEQYIPKRATLLQPLYRLLDTSQSWEWTDCEQHAFEVTQRLLTVDLTLVHYDAEKPLVLTCDGSEYGVGVILSHVMEDGQERPIAMISRTLHCYEQEYSQLDRKATSIIFGLTEFCYYLEGRRFRIVTDFKPLLEILDPKKAMPNMLTPRLASIAMHLTTQDYEIFYKPGAQIGNAESLSRWPQPSPEQFERQMYDILLMSEPPADFPYSTEHIAAETRRDTILSRIIDFMQQGWPAKETNSDLRKFWLHRLELSVHNDCILLGFRVVIPELLQEVVLKVFHKTHSGIEETKAIASSYVWWPNINEDIELLVSNCRNCLEASDIPTMSTYEWTTPTRPWSRIHVDFAGPYQNKYFLIIADAYSQWPEIFLVNKATSATVIQLLRSAFATHGLCDVLVSDRGTFFVSNEMKELLKSNNIRHVNTSPNQTDSDKLAKRMIQIIKNELQKITAISWDIKIPNLLLYLRSTPCTISNKSPAELLMNRRLRTFWDTLHPDDDRNSNTNNRQTDFEQDVFYRNHHSEGPIWLPGKIIGKNAPSNYRVLNKNGEEVNRNIGHLLRYRPHETMRWPGARMYESNQDIAERMIEVPNAKKWAEILGIPPSSRT